MPWLIVSQPAAEQRHESRDRHAHHLSITTPTTSDDTIGMTRIGMIGRSELADRQLLEQAHDVPREEAREQRAEEARVGRAREVPADEAGHETGLAGDARRR